VDAAWGVCKHQDLIRSGEATAVVIIAAQSFSMVDDLAEEMKMANGIDEFSSILAELAFMGSCEHVQTLFAATMLTVSQLVANEEKLLPDMASPLLELLKRCTKSMRQGTSGGSMRAEMFVSEVSRQGHRQSGESCAGIESWWLGHGWMPALPRQFGEGRSFGQNVSWFGIRSSFDAGCRTIDGRTGSTLFLRGLQFARASSGQ
jgi:hypothetical protein